MTDFEESTAARSHYRNVAHAAATERLPLRRSTNPKGAVLPRRHNAGRPGSSLVLGSCGAANEAPRAIGLGWIRFAERGERRDRLVVNAMTRRLPAPELERTCGPNVGMRLTWARDDDGRATRDGSRPSTRGRCPGGGGRHRDPAARGAVGSCPPGSWCSRAMKSSISAWSARARSATRSRLLIVATSSICSRMNH